MIQTAVERHRRYILRTLRACDGEIALADLKAGSGRNAGRPHFGMALGQLEREGLVRCVVVQGQTLVART